MTCFFCKGTIQNGTATFMVDVEGRIIMVKDVPAQICQQCGEVSYRDDIARKLEKIVSSLRATPSEINILNWNQAA